MRLLLDECVDRRLARDITGHETQTVPGMGWAGLKNGDLLRRAENDFDVFVTVDSNLPFQRDLSACALAVVVLQAPSNRLADLRPLIPELLSILADAKQGEVAWVGGEPT